MTITDFLDIPEDIVSAEKEYPHGTGNVIRVFSPGNGVYGDKVNGTFTVVYECDCSHTPTAYSEHGGSLHEHQALYGPAVKHADTCKHCELLKMWCDLNQSDHTFEALGKDVYDPSHFVLYAD